MRDYSKPFFDLTELTAAFNGICKCLGKSESCSESTISELGMKLSSLAKSFNKEIKPTGDLGMIGCNLQTFLTHLILNEVKTKEELRYYIDEELKQLPPHPIIDYFEN